MRKFIQNKLKNQKGLTLIELLAVIVILAIIAAIAIPAIGNIINNSRVGAIKSDGQNALAAAELFMLDNPDHFETGQPGAGGVGIIMTDLLPKYVDDEASFKGDTTFKVTKDATAGAAGDLVLTGVGKVGKVKLTFALANKAAITSLKNSTSKAGTSTTGIGTGTVTVTDR